MEPLAVTLDVRGALAEGREPFAMIMEAVAPLTRTGDRLLLIAPFEPSPLYRVLDGRGFDHEVLRLEDGLCEVRFTRR